MKKLFLFTIISFSIFLVSNTCQAQTLEEALGYGLPVVVVNTVNGEEPTAERVVAPEGCLGKSIINATKVPGRVRIYNPGDAENPIFDSGEYAENISGMTFKIRGNTSAKRPKNPFKIKLQTTADLLMRGDKYIRPEEQLCGAPGKRSLSFLAEGSGRTGLRLIYVRPWEKTQPPAKEYNLMVIVKDGTEDEQKRGPVMRRNSKGELVPDRKRSVLE